MVAVKNLIIAGDNQWRQRCWDLAQRKEFFEIHRMEASHFMFCQALCAEYDYTFRFRCTRTESIAEFHPCEKPASV